MSRTWGTEVDLGLGQPARSVIGPPARSARGNLVLRVGRERGSTWEQTEHVVLTPREARDFLAACLCALTPVLDEHRLQEEARLRADGWSAELAESEARARALRAPNEEGTQFIDTLTVAQVKRAAEWLDDGPSMDPYVRLWRLRDGSIDVHQRDAATNIDPDGTVNG
jgi:hypothetical protein